MRRTLALCLLAGLASGCGDGASRRPNLVVVTIDTCRADRLGCYGATRPETPTIDGLAANGVVFENAMATTPMTMPSHASIFTGLYPDRHGLRDNGVGRLASGAETLAEVLREAGWVTGAFVAAVPLEGRYGTDQGFDHYDDELLEAPEEGNIIHRLLTDQRTANQVVELAWRWISGVAGGDAPFFAWLHLFDPHSPYVPPPAQAQRWGAGSYEGEVAFVDEQIGRLLLGLGDERENTIVCIVADHGESLGEHGESSHGFFLYEAPLRIPWIVAGPGVPAGRRVATPVSQVDVMPTLLELLGLRVPDGLDGRPVWSAALAGELEPEPLYGEALFPRLNFDWAGTRCVRRGRWKYIEAPAPELYDLEADPHETTNLAAERTGVAAELRETLHDHWDRGGDRLASADIGMDRETRARLDALGYVGAESADPAANEAELWEGGRDPKETIAIFDTIKSLPSVVMGTDREAAREFVDSLVASDPGNLSLLRRIAQLEQMAGDWPAVERTCRRILSLEDGDSGAWLLLGHAAIERADTTAALSAYARTLELDPGSASAANARAQVLSRRGRPQEAVRILRDALPAIGDDPETLNNLAWILADHGIDPAEGLRHARRAAELAPDDPAILDTLGWAAIRAGQPEHGVAPLTTAWKDTGDPEVRAHLGVALAESGREDEGRAHVEAAVRERPELARVPEIEKWTRR